MPVKRTVAAAKLRGLLEEIPSLKQQRNSEQFKKWRNETKVAIKKTFGDDSNRSSEFEKIRYAPRLVVWGRGDNDSQYQHAHERGLETASAMLQSMLEEVDEYGQDAESC